ncbi:MAG: DUF2259 domain-containing protein [Blastochloris sp.]|nr:DUF2259 domain-containing protein [Blastochloris sp.]
MLRCIVLIALVGLIAGFGGVRSGAATPGDEADLLVLGFSADGRYFAYAQSGREPETWYPYASVHAIDVTTDKWLPDSPIAIVLKDREKTTRDARREAGETAEKRWGRLGLDTPGVTLLERTPGQPIDKGDEVVVTIPSIGPARVRLTPKLLPAEGCEGFAGESVGLILDLLTFDGNRIGRLQEDSSIPSSRGCPIGYAIAEMMVLERKDRAPVIAVVFAVFKVGATGIDRRYLAATADLAKK